MIVSRRPDGIMLVRQVDHQEQCEAMARAWGNAEFARPDAHDSLVVAARWHDEGWREWERAPRVDAAGVPVDFPDIDRGEHVALYAAAIDAACARDARAGLLVSMHGAGLHRARMGLDAPASGAGARSPAVTGFLEREGARQARLRARLGDGPGVERWAWASYRLLQAWDLLSLALLWGRLSHRDVVLRRVPRHEADAQGVDLVVRHTGPWRAGISPWPFATRSVELPVRARMIAPEPLSGDAALARALDAAPWIDLPAGVDAA